MSTGQMQLLRYGRVFTVKGWLESTTDIDSSWDLYENQPAGSVELLDRSARGFAAEKALKRYFPQDETTQASCASSEAALDAAIEESL
jgi:hypothetical protein